MTKFLCTCLIATTIVIVGCGTNESVQSETNHPSVTVSYQSDALADIEVSLRATSTGPILAKAISAGDGRARFMDVPSPEPSEYFVSLQSQGDGGWILDSKYASANNGLRLKPLAVNDQQEIKLPAGAVRPLTSNHQR